MRMFLLGSAALAALITIGSAQAADLGPRPAPVYKAPAMVQPVYSWTGCYVGIEGGGNWGQSHHTVNQTGAVAPPGADIAGAFDLSGGLVGGTLGCNYQMGQFVIGFEGDDSWTDKKGTGQDVAPFNTAFVQQTKEDWIATIRGRLGWTPAPQWLLYVTGGAAFAKIDVSEFNSTNPIFGASDSATQTGWTAGGGIEWMFLPNVSAKVEALYVDFGTHSFFNPPITPGNCGCVAANVKTTDVIARVGLDYHFNFGH